MEIHLGAGELTAKQVRAVEPRALKLNGCDDKDGIYSIPRPTNYTLTAAWNAKLCVVGIVRWRNFTVFTSNNRKATYPYRTYPTCCLSTLSDEILFFLLDFLSDYPSEVKSFSLKSLFNLESRHCLVEIDLSNAAEMMDVEAATISPARNLERMWLVHCKKVTDLGIDLLLLPPL
ncbi:hypothetical protein ACLOJK_009974 [Asimina triloba]